ncbi:MAG: glycosyltransferase family 2 protein, partial [Hyphomicrobiales bacterium]|nr:glycosyltransferase family 2 protein [Hyphomicrobiales bacterium]
MAGGQVLQIAPSISVVIPAFRAVHTIARTIESCLREVPARNVIVVMDGPDNAMEAVVRSTRDADGEPVRIIVMPNQQGASACRNRGLQYVDTGHVVFLDADDYIEPGALTAAGSAARDEGADIVFNRYCDEMPDGSRIEYRPADMYRPLNCANVLKMWLLEKYTPPCAVLWRTEYVRELGGWDASLRKNQDGDLMMRALVHGARLAVSPDGLSIYSQGDSPDRISRRHNACTLRSQFAVLEKLRLRLPDLESRLDYELGLAYYNLARLAYTHGFMAQGRAAQAAARGLGLHGHRGSRGHCILASILGLAGKQLLGRQLRDLREKLK